LAIAAVAPGAAVADQPVAKLPRRDGGGIVMPR